MSVHTKVEDYSEITFHVLSETIMLSHFVAAGVQN